MKDSIPTPRLPHLFTLVFGAIFGGSLVFLTPPYSVPDELQHFYRAYHCSLGKLYAERRDQTCGDDLPASILAAYQAIAGDAHRDEDFSVSWGKIRQSLAIPLDPARQHYATFENTALYSPVSYLPAAAAVCVGRMAELNPLVLLYLGRLATLIAYLALTVTAVRVMPVQKWTLALVAVMPMSMFLAASVSADAMTLGLALLVIALALDLALDPAPSAGRLAAFGLCLLLLALCKQAYIGLGLLFFIIPASRFAGRGQWLSAAGLILGLPLAANLAWAWSLRSVYVHVRPVVDPLLQIEWIGATPLSYAATLLKALVHPQTYLWMIGIFGWLGARLPGAVCLAYWGALAATAFLDGGRPAPLGARTKAAGLAIYAITASLVATLFYLSWEVVGNKNIDGIQPRYFLPLVPLLLLALRGGPAVVSARLAGAFVPISAILTTVLAAVATWATLACRYYL